MKALIVQSCRTLCDFMDCSSPGSSVHEFSRQEYWSRLPFPSPGDLPNPGIKPKSPTLQADSLLSEPPLNDNNLVILFHTSLPLLQLLVLTRMSFPLSTSHAPTYISSFNLIATASGTLSFNHHKKS